MNSQEMQFWDVKEGDPFIIPDSEIIKPNPSVQVPITLNTIAAEMGASDQDISGELTDIRNHSSLQTPSITGPERQFPRQPCKGEPSGSKRRYEINGDLGRTKQARRTKRTRSAELHNISERRRRDRISEKLRTLQALIPNCHKDRASILDDAIDYIKSLKHIIEMRSMSEAATYQAFYMSPTGIPTMQIPNFSPYAANMASPEIGMASMLHSAGLPITSVPLAYLHQSPALAAGLNLIMYSQGNLPSASILPSLPSAAASSSALLTFPFGFPAAHSAFHG